jgi:hypothetical protein
LDLAGEEDPGGDHAVTDMVIEEVTGQDIMPEDGALIEI